MTQEEFCKLTGIEIISGSDFAAIHTLYMAAGEMNKADFGADIKAGLALGASGTNKKFASTPIWMDKVAKTIERLEAENARLRSTVKDIEERKLEDAKKKEDLAYELRILGDQLDSSDLKEMSKKLCGAEFTARKAILLGMTLTEDEDIVIMEALEELDEYRQKVTREGERPDAAAAAGADS